MLAWPAAGGSGSRTSILRLFGLQTCWRRGRGPRDRMWPRAKEGCWPPSQMMSWPRQSTCTPSRCPEPRTMFALFRLQGALWLWVGPDGGPTSMLTGLSAGVGLRAHSCLWSPFIAPILSERLTQPLALTYTLFLRLRTSGFPMRPQGLGRRVCGGCSARCWQGGARTAQGNGTLYT